MVYACRTWNEMSTLALHCCTVRNSPSIFLSRVFFLGCNNSSSTHKTRKKHKFKRHIRRHTLTHRFVYRIGFVCVCLSCFFFLFERHRAKQIAIDTSNGNALHRRISTSAAAVVVIVVVVVVVVARFLFTYHKWKIWATKKASNSIFVIFVILLNLFFCCFFFSLNIFIFMIICIHFHLLQRCFELFNLPFKLHRIKNLFDQEIKRELRLSIKPL